MSTLNQSDTMKISGFTFLRNGNKFGYPFVESIRSILPIVDEFIVVVGQSEDGTEESVRAIGNPKIRVIPTQWNDHIRNDLKLKGFVYGQQKSIAHFNCTGDWAFYLEGDEVVHEEDLPKIRATMEKYLHDDEVEALAFDYIHFYGNANTYVWSPEWYRTQPRILRNNIPAWAPKGLFFIVMKDHKSGRYPKAAHTGARIFHYGWARQEEKMNAKVQAVERYWSNQKKTVHYEEINPQTLHLFTGTHPAAIRDWLPQAEGLFHANSNHVMTLRERRHRVELWIEKTLNIRFDKKHCRLVR